MFNAEYCASLLQICHQSVPIKTRKHTKHKHNKSPHHLKRYYPSSNTVILMLQDKLRFVSLGCIKHDCKATSLKSTKRETHRETHFLLFCFSRWFFDLLYLMQVNLCPCFKFVNSPGCCKVTTWFLTFHSDIYNKLPPHSDRLLWRWKNLGFNLLNIQLICKWQQSRHERNRKGGEDWQACECMCVKERVRQKELKGKT